MSSIPGPKGAMGEIPATTDLEQQVRTRIEGMSYLPTTVAVAMKFMELGRDPEADPADYARIIGSDSSLSSKLLSLANSSWFGVRNKVTRVQVAVNLLGLGTVRTLAISYCVAGLHNELRLNPEESRMFWAASLCKAVAAREFALLQDDKAADEAFATGLFQDFALPVMYATSRQDMMPILQDASIDWRTRLTKERALFRLDHAELARGVAQKLELPDLFVDAVAFHHNHPSLREFVGKPAVADATYLAGLFPHMVGLWNSHDAEEARQFIVSNCGNKLTPEQFTRKVDAEFQHIYRYFEQGDAPELRLADLLVHATREIADTTTRLVGTVQELMQQAASAGKEVHQLIEQHQQLEQTALRDPLTHVYNRDGFFKQALDLLARCERYKMSFGLAYFDLDNFKKLNDAAGHPCGDAVLKMAAQRDAPEPAPTDLVGRFGGDEFVILIADCAEQHAAQIVNRILAGAASQDVAGPGNRNHRCTLSAGLVWMPALRADVPLDTLISAADDLMYQAKRTGGNTARCVRWPASEKSAA